MLVLSAHAWQPWRCLVLRLSNQQFSLSHHVLREAGFIDIFATAVSAGRCFRLLIFLGTIRNILTILKRPNFYMALFRSVIVPVLCVTTAGSQRQLYIVTNVRWRA